MASSYVYFTEERFFNKRSRRARQHKKSNEIWQLSYNQRYVFLSVFSDTCTQDVFQNVLCTNNEWITSRHQLPTSRKIVKISKKCMLKQLCEVYAKAIIHLSVGE